MSLYPGFGPPLKKWLRKNAKFGICSLLALAACRDELLTGPATEQPKPDPAVAPAATATLVGAGNIARCTSSYDEATSQLLSSVWGTVFTTGDNIHASGAPSDFTSCFNPSWGRHAWRTKPSLGEKEYQTPGALGYFSYFNGAAGPVGKGYYSYDRGAWHIVVLNSNLSMAAGSPQERWLRADLASSGTSCTLAYWHHPMFASTQTGLRSSIKPVWDALYTAGVELVLNGHYRHYERFARQRPNGTADPQYGIVQITIGTGGNGVDAFAKVRANSVVRKSGVFGVLKLTLGQGTYSWRFLPVAGQSFSDSGSGTCHGKPGGGGGSIGAKVAKVDVTPSSGTTKVGGTLQLTAVAKDGSGATVPNQTMTWTSLNPLIAKVATSGMLTGLAAGTGRIVAACCGKADTAVVTVTSGTSATTIHKGFYAAPNGSSSGSGSISSPWSLATALSGGNGKVQPGDTVWLRGGTYRGSFVSQLRGRSGSPVVVRQYPGERAVLDGVGSSNSGLQVYGDYSVFWGFELINSGTNRTTSSTSHSWRSNTLVNNADNTRYINLVVHDGGVAFYNYTNRSNVEVNGSIFYNNGWQGPSRGHGHAIYLRSDAGPIMVKDNIIFNQFGYGIHAYTDAGRGKLINIRLEGNVAFNNGTLSNNSNSANILLGGDDYASGDALINNYAYFSPGAGAYNVRVGWGSLVNGSLTLQGNYAVGGSPVLEMGYWGTVNVSSNTFIGSSTLIALNDRSPSGQSWSGNEHRRDPSASAWKYGSSSYNWSGWKSATRLASGDQAVGGTPSGIKVIVRPNQYEKGRANIIVYNWPRQGSVSVSLAGIVPVGQSYEIRNVQDFFGRPVASGVYNGGSVTLPLGGVAPPVPIGMSSSRAPRTGPNFDVFVVTQ